MLGKFMNLCVTFSVLLVTATVAVFPSDSVSIYKETTKEQDVVQTYAGVNAGISKIITTPADLFASYEDEGDEENEVETPIECEIEEVEVSYDVPLSKELQDKVSYYLDYMGIELDVSYIYALIYQESRFNPKATGSSGDSGYCQILQKYFDYIYSRFCDDYPELVKSENLKYDVFDEKTNIACGVYWLGRCAKDMSGKPLSRDNLTSALTAYNRGVSGAKLYYEKHNTYVTNYSSAIIDVASYLQENKELPN